MRKRAQPQVLAIALCIYTVQTSSETRLVLRATRHHLVNVCNLRSREREDGVHELLVVHLHPAAAVRVEPLERLRDLLHHDARAHEAVERDPPRARRHAGAATGATALMKIYPHPGRPVSHRSINIQRRKARERSKWEVMGVARRGEEGTREQGGGGGGEEGALTVLGLEEAEERGREVVAELLQRVGELLPVDRARTVAVKVAEDVLPVLDVLPQPRELVEPDRSAPVRVLYVSMSTTSTGCR